jgi:hypothetical protein
MKPDCEKSVRHTPPMLPLDRRIGIAEVEKVYPEAGRRRVGFLGWWETSRKGMSFFASSAKVRSFCGFGATRYHFTVHLIK